MEENSIVIAIITLGIGGLIGYFAGRSSSADSSAQEKKVDALKVEINQYKESVASHFQQTATMINEMNDSYKSVVQHLAKGSQDLCDAGTARDIESRLLPKLEEQPDSINETELEQQTGIENIVEPPRDYAPKKPDEIGALSENYGITPKINSETDDQLNSASQAPVVDAPLNKS